MDRLRSTKLRARRIELDYFTRRAPLRTWRVVLSLAGLAVAGAWIATVAARRHQAFQPGPVSTAHALFGARCETCHDGAVEAAVVGTTGPRWQAATDAACQRCHQIPDHQVRQTPSQTTTSQATTPPCGRCHAEHRGPRRLAAVATGACVACHGNLGAHASGEPRVVGADARAIRGFAATGGHPEFAVWTDARRVRLDATPPPADGTALALNHRVHLQPALRGPAGPVQLTCGDCHEGTTSGPTRRTAGAAADLAPAEESAYMAPVTFARHCASCHPNSFDPRFPALPAPHDRPEVIHAFLHGLYGEYAVAHPEVLTDARRRVLGGETTGAVRSAADWASEQAAQAEELLFEDPKRCAQCHTLERAPGVRLPTVVPPRLPTRWLPQSVFDHGAHRLLGCAECHAAATSEKTTDVLLPRAATCRGCHRPEGAPDRCSECHTYHAATGPREMNGRQRIPELAAGHPATLR